MAELSKKELAARYGWSMALLNSDPELKRLFNRAVKKTWTPERFVAELRSTKWYKRNGEKARAAITLKKTDPGTWKERVREKRSEIISTARQIGATIGSQQLNRIAEDAIMMGWDPEKIRRGLEDYIKRTDQGNFRGQAAAYDQQLREYAREMGVDLPRKKRSDWVRDLAVGNNSLEYFTERIRKRAESMYPQFKERLREGETMYDIASPYRETIGKLLEVDPERISWSNKTLQRGLGERDKDGYPKGLPLWKFEDIVRQDPAWKKTDNAKRQTDAITRNLLTSWGFIS